jgi:hypothetical protein
MEAYSADVDTRRHLIKLRAHFYAAPSDEDLDELFCVEGEIHADYDADDTKIETEIEVMAPGAEPAFLPGGVAFRRGQED